MTLLISELFKSRGSDTRAPICHRCGGRHAWRSLGQPRLTIPKIQSNLLRTFIGCLSLPDLLLSTPFPTHDGWKGYALRPAMDLSDTPQSGHWHDILKRRRLSDMCFHYALRLSDNGTSRPLSGKRTRSISTLRISVPHRRLSHTPPSYVPTPSHQLLLSSASRRLRLPPSPPAAQSRTSHS